MTSDQCFVPPKVWVKGELISKNILSTHFWMPSSFFAYFTLFSFSQGAVFTQFEGISYLNTHWLGGEKEKNDLIQHVGHLYFSKGGQLLIVPFLDIFLIEIRLWLPSYHESWFGNLTQYCLQKIQPQCCFDGRLLSCFCSRVHMLGKTVMHLPWGKTSRAIEFAPI